MALPSFIIIAIGSGVAVHPLVYTSSITSSYSYPSLFHRIFSLAIYDIGLCSRLPQPHLYAVTGTAGQRQVVTWGRAVVEIFYGVEALHHAESDIRCFSEGKLLYSRGQ